jgi:hypothetical protein
LDEVSIRCFQQQRIARAVITRTDGCDSHCERIGTIVGPILLNQDLELSIRHALPAARASRRSHRRRGFERMPIPKDAPRLVEESPAALLRFVAQEPELTVSPSSVPKALKNLILVEKRDCLP